MTHCVKADAVCKTGRLRRVSFQGEANHRRERALRASRSMQTCEFFTRWMMVTLRGSILESRNGPVRVSRCVSGICLRQ